MRLDAALTVCRKELLETLRDRRTLILMLVAPILLYPLMAIISVQVMTMLQSRIDQKVLVVGHPQEDSLFSAEDLATVFEDRLIELRAVPDEDQEAQVRRGELAAGLRFSGTASPTGDDSVQLHVSVIYDSGEVESSAVRERIEQALRERGEQLVASRLERLNQDASFIEPFDLERADVASAEQRGAFLLGGFLSFVLITMALMGAFYPSLDLTAGERERGTLETLLVAPVGRREMILGKYLTVLIISMVTALLNIACMGLTFSQLFVGIEVMKDIQFQISASVLLRMVIVLLPLAALFSALTLGTSSFARSYKEGQTYLTPIYLVVIFPSMVALFPGIDLSFVVAAIPVAGPALLFRELLMEKANPLHLLMVLGSTVLYAGVVLTWVAGLFEREEVLYRSPEAGSGLKRPLVSTPSPSPVAAVGLFVVVLSLMGYLSLGSASPTMFRALILPQLLVLCLPIGVAWWCRHRPPVTFSLSLPRPRTWLAVPLILIGELPLVLLITSSLGLEADETMEMLEAFVRMLLTDAGPIGALALIALLPAVCEETLCRGFVLSGLRSGMRPALAIVISAALFGALHMSAVRFPPTVLLGLLLAFVVVRTGSLWPAMLLHFCHNGLLLICSQTYADAHPEAALTGFAQWLLGNLEKVPLHPALGIVPLVAGLVLLPGRVRERQ